jgi:hypothetical protein
MYTKSSNSVFTLELGKHVVSIFQSYVSVYKNKLSLKITRSWHRNIKLYDFSLLIKCCILQNIKALKNGICKLMESFLEKFYSLHIHSAYVPEDVQCLQLHQYICPKRDSMLPTSTLSFLSNFQSIQLHHCLVRIQYTALHTFPLTIIEILAVSY